MQLQLSLLHLSIFHLLCLLQSVQLLSSQNPDGILLLCEWLFLCLFYPSQNYVLVWFLDTLFLLLIQFLLLDCVWLLLLKLPSPVLLLTVLFFFLFSNQSLNPTNPVFPLKYQFLVLLECLHLLTRNIVLMGIKGN